jgi:glycerate dehydrogenase
MSNELRAGRPRIVFLDRDTLPSGVRLRSPSFDHEWISFGQTGQAEVASRIVDADIVVTNKAPVRRDAIETATKLVLVAVAATGTDNVDLDACAPRGITVSNIRGYALHTVPEHTFALILALRRNIIAYRNSVGRGRWADTGQFSYFDYPVNDLAGSTLGVIGDGVIGRAVSDLGRAFGMTVLFASYKGVTGMGPLYTPFEEVLRTSDVITLHAPLLPSTLNMIGREEFALMQRQPLLINTARGGLVDEAALCEALEQGRIGGAGFDVATKEPPPPDHSLLRLLDRPNFILTPHVAWSSAEATQTLANQLIDNVEAFWAGKARNVVV